MRACVRVCVCACACVCARAYVCVCMCACVCVCVFVVNAFFSLLTFPCTLLCGMPSRTPSYPTAPHRTTSTYLPACLHACLLRRFGSAGNKYTDGATALTFPFGWAQINSCGTGGGDYTNPVFNPATPPANCGSGCAPECSTTCLGELHEWADYGQGFTGIRYAQDNTLASVVSAPK